MQPRGRHRVTRRLNTAMNWPTDDCVKTPGQRRADGVEALMRRQRIPTDRSLKSLELDPHLEKIMTTVASPSDQRMISTARLPAMPTVHADARDEWHAAPPECRRSTACHSSRASALKPYNRKSSASSRVNAMFSEIMRYIPRSRSDGDAADRIIIFQITGDEVGDCFLNPVYTDRVCLASGWSLLA